MNKKENNYTVYVHINKTNGKMYIGQTCKTPEERWNKGNGYKTSTYFWNSIQKYGWNNFNHIILIENLSVEEANVIEMELIKKYNTTNSKYGYNLRIGGKNGITLDKTKKKISNTLKIVCNTLAYKEKCRERSIGERNPNYGKLHNDETKEIMSNKAKNRLIIKENHPRYGIHLTDKTKDKIRKANLNHHITEEQRNKKLKNSKNINEVCKLNKDFEIINKFDTKKLASEDAGELIIMKYPDNPFYILNDYIYTYTDLYDDVIKSDFLMKKLKNINYRNNCKAVICLNDLSIYYSMSEASVQKRVDQSSIVMCCNGKRKCGGSTKELGKLIWEYYDENKKYVKKYYSGVRARKCLCITTKKEFSSSSEASNYYNIDKSSINYACLHNKFTQGGNTNYDKLQWRYVD